MRKIYNFNAGPGMLPEEVLQEAQKELLSWHGTGMSIMELGHRGNEFKEVAEQSEQDLRDLMNIPDNYHVLFLPGGATAQFSMVPMNLMGERIVADYVDTGIWSKKAIEEAKRYGTINIAAEVKKAGLATIPPQSEWHLNSDAAYVHYTPNETIEGIEFNWVPKTGNVPLVADMSSMILSRPVDVTQYGIIYAGAQKNVGQAGIAIIIVHDDLLRNPLPNTPTLYHYKVQAENNSFYNTPPTYSWYFAGLMLAWMKRKGGVGYFTEVNQRKAKKLYGVIDKLAGFYTNNVDVACRSNMNVVFDLQDNAMTDRFLSEAADAGLMNLKGHRLAGGVRASIYNAMPEEGVDALVSFMQDFAAKNG